MAISVVVAVGAVADALVDAIEARLDKVRIGPGTDPDTEMGPLITGEHRDKVASYLDVAAAEGATVRRDGREQAFDGDGFFLGLSLVDDVAAVVAAAHRGDLRPGAVGHPGRHLRRGRRAHQRPRVRQRLRDLHP